MIWSKWSKKRNREIARRWSRTKWSGWEENMTWWQRWRQRRQIYKAILRDMKNINRILSDVE